MSVHQIRRKDINCTIITRVLPNHAHVRSLILLYLSGTRSEHSAAGNARTRPSNHAEQLGWTTCDYAPCSMRGFVLFFFYFVRKSQCERLDLCMQKMATRLTDSRGLMAGQAISRGCRLTKTEMWLLTSHYYNNYLKKIKIKKPSGLVCVCVCFFLTASVSLCPALRCTVQGGKRTLSRNKDHGKRTRHAQPLRQMWNQYQPYTPGRRRHRFFPPSSSCSSSRPGHQARRRVAGRRG
jgi:hypothetical protein